MWAKIVMRTKFVLHFELIAYFRLQIVKCSIIRFVYATYLLNNPVIIKHKIYNPSNTFINLEVNANV